MHDSIGDLFFFQPFFRSDVQLAIGDALASCQPHPEEPTCATGMRIPPPHNRHFLLVTVEAQGHINPARHLAHRLARHSCARATIAIPSSAHRRMFPSSTANTVVEEDCGGLVSYVGYSNGVGDSGLDPSTDLPEITLRIKDSLSRLAADISATGRPVTCILYTLFLYMAAEVAEDLGVPSVLFWIQPAAVFAIYYRYFHGYRAFVAAHRDVDPSFEVHLPGLPPFHIRDLPSLLTTSSGSGSSDPYAYLSLLFKGVFETLDREMAIWPSKKPVVLVNTFQELEAEALSSIEEIEMVAAGPLVAMDVEEGRGGDLYEEDKSGYMEWLERKEDGSVVYVSFGSISKMSERQMEEIATGLSESGRPWLWVVRPDNREGGGVGDGGGGMVVEWCSQSRVLSHRAVGCFVTHCGWNSTLEAVVEGVATVMVPQWTDQATNARLAEGEWGTGVRAKVDGEGVLEGKELRRCLDLVMGEEGAGVRLAAAEWKDKARAAAGEGASSIKNLNAFVDMIGGGRELN